MRKTAILFFTLCLAILDTVTGGDSAPRHIRQMEICRSKGDWGGMEKALLRALGSGRRDEYILRSLSWAYARQGKGEEAVRIAMDNWRHYPCAWSIAQVADAAIANDDFGLARTFLKKAMGVPDSWGRARKTIESMCERVSVKTYEFVWDVDPARIPALKRGAPRAQIPLPTTGLPYQTATWTVTGAKNWKEEIISGNRCLSVEPDGLNHIVLRAEVTITPYSYRPFLARYRSGGLPDEVQPYLVKTGGIDPNDPLVQKTLTPLRAHSDIETVESILLWCDEHIAYYGGPKGTSGGTAAQVLRRGKGHCEARSSVAVALLRAAGVPARLVRGHSAVVGQQGHPKWHSIVEFYINRVGWISWDYDRKPFQVRTSFLRTFHYASPYDCPVPGDRSVVELSDFQVVGLGCGFVTYHVTNSSLD